MEYRLIIQKETIVCLSKIRHLPNRTILSFAVWALKDPQSGNLDRIQIVKDWINPRIGSGIIPLLCLAPCCEEPQNRCMKTLFNSCFYSYLLLSGIAG